MIRYWHSHKHGLNFLGIPKTGSSSVRRYLDIDVENDWNWAKTFDYPVFTVLRDPVNRVFSGYRELRRQGVVNDVDEFIQKIKTRGFFDVHCMPMSYFTNQNFTNIDHVLILERGLKKEFVGLASVKGSFVENRSTFEPVPYDFKKFVKKYYPEDFVIYENGLHL